MSKEQNYWSFLSTRHLFLSISHLLVWSVCFGQEEGLNTIALYPTDAPINCKFTLLDQGDSLWIFAALEFKQVVKDSSLWIKTSWTTGNQILQDSVQLRRENNRRSVVKWGFTPQTLPNLFTLELNWKARTWTFQEHFPISAFHPSGGLSLRDSSKPLVTGWIHSHDSILINTVGNKKVFAYFYDHEFDPARPPMTLRPGKGSGTLDIDTILVLIPDQNFTLEKPGL